MPFDPPRAGITAQQRMLVSLSTVVRIGGRMQECHRSRVASPRSRNVSELLAAFIAFEEREQLFERSICGVAYWQLIRHDVFRETLESLGLSERAHLRVEELPLRSWLGPQLRQLPRTLARSFWSEQAPAELLVAAHPRHVPYQGRFICPYSQPLLWATPRSRLVLEGHFQGHYFAPDAGERTRYVDLGLVLAHAGFRIRELQGRGLSARDRAELANLVNGLTRALGGAPPAAALLRRARTAVLVTLGLTPRLARLLDAVRPKLVLEVVGYRLVNQVLNQLAHSRGIAVAELQHGTLGTGHAGYTFAPGRKPSSFPDQLLLFGALWREATPGLPLTAEQTPAIGYAWLELQRAQLTRGARPADGPRRVLFLSQRSIGRELSRVASALRTKLPARSFEIVYRLHPSEGVGWQSAYPELAASGIRVERAEERALYASQNDADVQVGVYSTALIEGVAFGLATLLVQLPGHEQLALLAASGIARTVADADALADAVRTGAAPAAAGEALWARGATTNFARFIEAQLR
jgi:hypothetical protein